MTTTILALDLGKFNSVLCWYESESQAPAFRSVKSTPELLRVGPGRVNSARAEVVNYSSKSAGLHLASASSAS